MRRGQQTLLNAGKGLIAWDKWQDDPAAAAGESVFNVASFIVPVGAATAPVRASASTAAAAIRTAPGHRSPRPGLRGDQGRRRGHEDGHAGYCDLAKSVDLATIDMGNLGPGTKIDLPDIRRSTHPRSRFRRSLGTT